MYMCRPGEITVHTSPLSHSCIVTKLNLKTKLKFRETYLHSKKEDFNNNLIQNYSIAYPKIQWLIYH